MLKRILCLVFAAFVMVPVWAQEKGETERVIEDHEESRDSAEQALDSKEDAEKRARQEKQREEPTHNNKSQGDKDQDQSEAS